jgi:hypothetical protein
LMELTIIKINGGFACRRESSRDFPRCTATIRFIHDQELIINAETTLGVISINSSLHSGIPERNARIITDPSTFD